MKMPTNYSFTLHTYPWTLAPRSYFTGFAVATEPVVYNVISANFKSATHLDCIKSI